MKRLVRLEYQKIINNKFIFILIFFVFIFLITYIIYLQKEGINSFVNEQHNQAEIMLTKISLQENEYLEGIQKQKESYKNILSSSDWKKIYTELNIIDSLFFEYDYLIENDNNDMKYDRYTNIELRTYFIDHDVNPHENTSGIILKNIMDNAMNYVAIIVSFLISIYVIRSEYEEQSSCYYYTLPFSYKKIYFTKCFTSIMISLISFIIPIIIVIILLVCRSGITNSGMIVEVNKQFSDVMINGKYFLTLYKYLLYALLYFIIIISIIDILTISIFMNVKNMLIATGIVVSNLVFFSYLTPILLYNKFINLTYSAIFILLLYLLVVFLIIIVSLYMLRKKCIY